jgi:hypothetical protein
MIRYQQEQTMTAATPIMPKIPNRRVPPYEQPADGVNNHQLFKVDYLEAGSSGPVVMLVHSSIHATGLRKEVKWIGLKQHQPGDPASQPRRHLHGNRPAE